MTDETPDVAADSYSPIWDFQSIQQINSNIAALQNRVGQLESAGLPARVGQLESVRDAHCWAGWGRTASGAEYHIFDGGWHVFGADWFGYGLTIGANAVGIAKVGNSWLPSQPGIFEVSVDWTVAIDTPTSNYRPQTSIQIGFFSGTTADPYGIMHTSSMDQFNTTGIWYHTNLIGSVETTTALPLITVAFNCPWADGYSNRVHLYSPAQLWCNYIRITRIA